MYVSCVSSCDYRFSRSFAIFVIIKYGRMFRVSKISDKSFNSSIAWLGNFFKICTDF